MSTVPDPAAPPGAAPAADRPRMIKIVSHSPIFYWWPVWLVGFVMAALTYWDGYAMALVPVGATAETGRQVEGYDGPRDVVVLPPGRGHRTDPDAGTPEQPQLRMAASNNLGVIWAFTLCLVVVITHIHLRGLASVIVIILLTAVAIIFALLGWWDPILRTLQVIDIHMNAFGYLSISLFLLGIWAFSFFVYDRYVYMVFTRGQLRVRAAIGDGETVYDTRGMIVEKHRDDLFRHWLLGFGSGDLSVRVGGVNGPKFELPNVTGIDRKLSLIQQMVQEREVVEGTHV